MKKYRDFIPRADAELGVYAKEHISSFREMAGQTMPYLTEEQISAHELKVQRMIETIQQVENMKASLASAVAAKKEAIATATSDIRRMAMFIKKGNLDGNIYAGSSYLKCTPVRVDPKEVKPEIRATVIKGKVLIGFKKLVPMPVAVYSRIPGKTDFELLGYTNTSPYEDTRALSVPDQPERRDYKICFTDYKSAAGQMSNIETVIYDG